MEDIQKLMITVTLINGRKELLNMMKKQVCFSKLLATSRVFKHFFRSAFIMPLFILPAAVAAMFFV